MGSGFSGITRRFSAMVAIFVVVLLGIGVLGLSWGTPSLSLGSLWNVLFGHSHSVESVVVWQSRMPRYVLGALCGSLLALAGVLLQDSMRNAIAGPEILGVSAGSATVMAAIIILQIPVASILQPWLALLGGVMGGGTVVLANRNNQSPVRLVLIGVAVSSFLNALIVVIVSMGQESTITLFYSYLMGGLENRYWTQVVLVLPWLIVIPVALSLARKLNILRLGDEVAKGLGMKVIWIRVLILIVSIALVAPVIAACGPIGYISLLSPHVARKLLGTQDAIRVLPMSALVGAVLLTGADIVARQLFSPVEIPVGVWTTLLGGPLLLILLNRRLGSAG
ncbi:FecCD family ABC transporter permease [Alicyclobacillus cycloheptanicus]|uniref:Iron complex transport system permease protein n=1 Tax=Alicyclobacillus cycloheptanicus TaxID=1457 RepID=A0ABT9XHA0_9BACL|nr:iron ABC transporter permease [Alicyclobacillus cycloheptanicus]MDQ0189686.1 iron complex transport system permease protein [Alicyclobacillus cycloheptanicus]